MDDVLKEKHESLLYPTVRVRTMKAGGSGTVIYSKPVPEGSEREGYETYVLTNCHVINDNIKVEKKWSTLLKREVKTDVLADCTVELFDFEYGSWESGHSAFKAEIECYDKDMDLGLLRVKSTKPFEYVSTMFPKGEHMKRLRCFMDVYAVGCGLGHPPLATQGNLTGFTDIIDNYTYWLSTAPTIYGNCNLGDTLVSMADNTVKQIKDVVPGDHVYVCRKWGLNKSLVRDVVESGEKDIYKVITRTRSTKASENHPFLKATFIKDWNNRNKYNFEWVALKDLNEGDIIAVLDGLPERAVGKFNFADMFGQYKCEKPEFKEKLMKLIGFIVGNSYINYRPGISYGLSLYPYNKELAGKYKEIVELVSGKEVAPASDDNEIMLYDKEFVDLLVSFELNKKSHEISIPDFIFTLEPELQMAFIEGYLDSDGYINPRGDWAFEATSRSLIHKLRMMCVHLGMNVSNIHSRKRDTQKICGRDVKEVKKCFAFQVYPNYSKSRDCFFDGVNSLEIPPGIHVEKIRKIKHVGKEMTYDLCIDGTHNFFADGVLVHNSGGSLYLEDTYEFIGIPSRIAVSMSGFSADAITHLSYFIPITSIYKFLEDQIFTFLYDDSVNSVQCAVTRKEKRERDEKTMAVDTTRAEVGDE